MEKVQYGQSLSFEIVETINELLTPQAEIVFVSTKDHGDVLLMDGEVQLSTLDEYRYHESLVHPTMKNVRSGASVLIIGGGDGCAAREVFKWNVNNVTIVDHDSAFVHEYGMKHLKDLNKGIFFVENLRYICSDALNFLQDTKSKYDAIFIDLPDPDTMLDLYIGVIEASRTVLNPGGSIGMHVGPALLNSNPENWKAIKSCKDTLTHVYTGRYPEINFSTCYVPSFSNEWAFLHMTCRKDLIANVDRHPVCRYWNAPNNFQDIYRRLV
jgi:predicted membrane-bound spermidine synthase